MSWGDAGGPYQLTHAETVFVEGLAGQPYVLGDMLYFNGTTLTRLPVGGANMILTVSGGIPTWAASVLGAITPSSVTLPYGGSITWTVGGGGTNSSSITNSANKLTFSSGGTSTYLFDAAITPTVAGSSDLGTTGVPWGNINLATGGVINWNNGNMTITHASGKITLAGGPLVVPTNGLTINATNVTSTGTQLNYLNAATGTTGTTSTNLVFSTSPTFITPTLGVASATSLATSAASPLLLTNGQLVTIALTSQTVGGTTLTIPNFANVNDTFVFITLAQTLSNKTFVAPALGAATATSINSLIITTSAGTLTIANNASASLITSGNFGLTLTSTATTNSTFPSGTDTLAGLGTTQTFTATNTHKQIVFTNNAITASGNAATVPITYRLNTVTNNSAATLTITMTTTSAVDGQLSMVRILDATAAAQTVTWVNTENSTVSAPTTSNGSTTLFLTVGFIYNSGTSKWRCIASA